ncbi:type IV secretion system immunity protein Tsi1 [Uliginosibacterium flavum]|uniref:Uncharacterized protein n=1 Tax=Uliginosibacterium flavum TaxID=1396831 RepID=A0ABV2TLY0_9RHOO
MKIHFAVLSMALASAQALAGAPTAPCAITNIPVDPAPPGQFASYAGHGHAIDILLQSARPDREVDVFPEPPLILRRKDTQKSCEIDGGIWTRKDFYLDASERTLITVEFSGSSDSLNFYDTASCKRLASLDISGYAWAIGKNALTLTAKQGKAKTRSRRVNSFCIPN